MTRKQLREDDEAGDDDGDDEVDPDNPAQEDKVRGDNTTKLRFYPLYPSLHNKLIN